MTFIYCNKKVYGRAEFIGRTEFSSNILCGVALLERIGKHNGTVKGRYYFKCPEKHGVFVPLRKICHAHGHFRERIKKRLEKLASEEENTVEIGEEDIEDVNEKYKIENDMRITVRSYKAPKRLPTCGESVDNIKTSLSSPPPDQKITNHSCSDSGVESPTEHNSLEKIVHSNPPAKLTSSPKKNIVVSSFIAESPKKPIFTSFDDDSGHMDSSFDTLNERLSTKKKDSIDSTLFDLNVDVLPKEYESQRVLDVRSEMKMRMKMSGVKDETQTKGTVTTSTVDNDTDSEDGKSKIPKRVPTVTKMFGSAEELKSKGSSKVTSSPIKRTTKLETSSKYSATPPPFSTKLRQPSLKSYPRRTSKAEPHSSLASSRQTSRRTSSVADSPMTSKQQSNKNQKQQSSSIAQRRISSSSSSSMKRTETICKGKKHLLLKL